ncbi:hypothetical protein CR513_07894, partial [Mucuna pruriens]
MQQQPKTTPLPFPSQTISAKKPETDEELLKMFRRIPKYAKFLKELCVHKRNKLKEGAKVGVTFGTKPALPRKCRDLGIFSVPCTIGGYTFVDAMLDLGALINVMPTSMYKSLNFGDLEPTSIAIQLANQSVVQLVSIFEDVLVQVNDLIFPIDFYVLEMEDEASEKGSTLILGRPFLMTERMKIDMHAGTLSMEFGDNLVQFNIFDAIRHLIEDYSLYSMDVIDELVEEYNQYDSDINDMTILVEIYNMLEGADSVMGDADTTHMNEVLNRPNSDNHVNNLANLMNTEQEERLLAVLRKHKKSIRWKLSNLPRINPSICMHKILMEEEARPIRQQ